MPLTHKQAVGAVALIWIGIAAFIYILIKWPWVIGIGAFLIIFAFISTAFYMALTEE